MKVTATGRLVSDRAGIRLQFSYDLAKLWNWHILKGTGMILHTALRCSKIGLHTNKSYHKAKVNKAKLKKLVGKKFTVTFDLKNIKYTYTRRGYWVSYIQVDDTVVWDLLSELNLSSNFVDRNKLDNTDLSRLNMPHMSIANGKYIKELKAVKSDKWFWDNQFTTLIV